MSNKQIEAKRILSEYGRRMYDSRIRFFSVDNKASANNTYRSVRIKSFSHTVKRALILCAVLILVMSLTLAVCSALGLQIFNYKFDIKEGFIVITNLDDEDGTHFYRPKYVANGYVFKEVVPLGESSRYYVYANRIGQEYIIEESTSKDAIVYIDSEGYDVQNETYNGYELIIYKDQSTPKIITYLEKDSTFISISGLLSIDEIHAIIDSLYKDTD